MQGSIRRLTATALAALFGVCLACPALADPGTDPAADPTAGCEKSASPEPAAADQAPAEGGEAAGAEGPREPVKLPGLIVDFENCRVDVDAKVCLDRGALELIACTVDSKEHESIFTVESAPVQIHAALLMLGAKNGHPAMVKPADEAKTRWVHLPPRGEKVRLTVVYKSEDGKQVERPISDFVQRNRDLLFNEPLNDEGQDDENAREDKQEPASKVFEVFLFAGSHVLVEENGNKRYLADDSGNVISISTFGDELLCLPQRNSQDNAALAWMIKRKHLPKLGTQVKLRLSLVDDKKDDTKQPEAGEKLDQDKAKAE